MVSKRPGRPKSTAKRDQIIAAARALFPRNGIADTSMADIAAHAGVAKQTLYSHFADKEALFREVLARVRAERTPDIPAAQANTGSARPLVLIDQDIMIAMAGLGSYLVELITDPELAALRRIMFTEAATSEWSDLWALDGPAPLRAALAHDLEHRAEFQVADPEFAADQFFAMITHRPIMDSLSQQEPPPDPVAHYHVVDACVAFLRAFAPGAE